MFRAFVLAVAMAAASSSVSASPSRIDFTLRTTGSAPVHVQFGMRDPNGGRNQWSQSIPAAELRGFVSSRLSSGRAPVSFALVRPAGRLDCAGAGQRGRAAGECRFTTDPGFASALEHRGLGRPTDQQAYQLALSNVGLDLVEALDRAGTKADIKGLVACGIFRVTPELVRSYSALGYSGLTTAQLVEFQIFKVTPDYIRAVGRGSERASPKALVERRILGPGFIR
jgi:hypothetical protein